MAYMFAIYDNFIDESDEFAHFLILRHSVVCQILMRFSAILRRKHLPRLGGFSEETIPHFTNEDFKLHFRISKGMFEEILARISPRLVTVDHGGGIAETPPCKQLLIFLSYIANQESMREVSLYFDVGMATVHKTIRKVSSTINECLGSIIQWPTFMEQQTIPGRIQLKNTIPDTVGFLDGTHIRLSSGPGGDPDYINRKSFPSMQLQVVCDDTLLIRNIYTGWPGSTHDARVLRNSELFTQAEAGNLLDRNKIILADSAYPLKGWLITPFRDNGRLGANQRRFNRILSSARQSIERCIGHLKGMFRTLREIPFHKPEDIVSLIVSGCTLHNLCILHEDDVDDFIEGDDIGHPNNYPNIFRNDPNGINRRLAIMARLP
ncbi:putative nuclease HARBI1 [Saccostrea cucullata]|uniref:putative nuclease HARBI1 n=1 Tax=Saccostrea cuccullata TaxID=36930 RepID=UPI002ED23C80